MKKTVLRYACLAFMASCSFATGKAGNVVYTGEDMAGTVYAGHDGDVNYGSNVNIRGIVIDEKGRGIKGAVVSLPGGRVWTNTSDEGTFGIKVPKGSRIRVDAGNLGYKEFVVGKKNVFVVTFHTGSRLRLPMVNGIPYFDGSSVFMNFLKPLRVRMVNGVMYVNTSFSLPLEYMSSEKRIVMQPVVMEESDKAYHLLKPMVFDGKDFSILLERGHECGNVDELKYYSNYSVAVDDDNKYMTFHYSDSCRLDSENSRIKTMGLVKIVSFCGDEVTDCARITNGCSNPLQMFDYSVLAHNLDNSHAPKQGKVKFEHEGSIKLNFKVNEFKIYMGDGNNAAELNTLKSALMEIENDPGKSLESFSIYGYTSPEATYKYNKELSGKRMQAALDAIMGGFKNEIRSSIRLESGGIVTPWDSVSNAMRMEWRISEADKLDEVIEKCRGDHDCISAKVPKMGIYGEVKKFLPRFRKVMYKYEYAVFRTLTDREIEDIYHENPADLTPSELWRHFCLQPNMTVQREVEFLKEMLAIYPDLMIAANRLAVLMIRNNTPDCNVLAGFMDKDVPDEVKVNHIVALLMRNRTEEARVLAEKLNENEKTAAVKAVINAIYGNDALAAKGLYALDVYNRTVMLLALEKNEDAYELSKKISGMDSYSEYVKAMAANRMGHKDKAKIHLKKALDKNPQLGRIAVVDADVSDLLRR